MSYCTQQDIEDRIGEEELAALADHDEDGTPDAAVVEGAIASAQALMDSYIAVRYAVPVELPEGETPAALTTRAVSLAVYFLRLGRDSVTDDVREQHRDDVAWLRDVAAGRVRLGASSRPREALAAPSVRHSARPRVFGRGEPL